MLDLVIVLIYFAVIMIAALSGKQSKEAGIEAYFLSNRNLRWPSIAISTIATNVQGYQFLGMMGSAYLYGLAQANFEINAMQGLLMAAFIFVPMYLSQRVITITQFIEKKLGKVTALIYTTANILLFATIGLGAALFWGAYAADIVFSEYLTFISDNQQVRVGVLILSLGVFSAIYTYMGGLSAVVKTDIIQFGILTLGGIVVLFTAVHELGGWQQLYIKTPEMMTLHLPADHPKLGWLGMFGLFFLNINYWCANQTVMQRSLAAKSLKQAQVGLMVGGVMKYLMAIIIIVPGIALFGIIGDTPDALTDPDQAYPHLIKTYLKPGILGIILCALFASLMSTVDSTFNSLATLFSIDIYKGYLKKEATEQEVVATGRKTILVTLVTGVLVGLLLMKFKFGDPAASFTHELNDIRNFVNSGIAVLICTAGFVVFPKQRIAIGAFVGTILLHTVLKFGFPDLPYLVRALVVISTALGVTILAGGLKPAKDYLVSSEKGMGKWGLLLLGSLVLLHIIFH